MFVFQPEGEQAQEQGREDQAASQGHARSLQGTVEPGQVAGDAHVQTAEEKAPAEVGNEMAGQAAHSGVAGQEKADKLLRVEAEDKEHDHAQRQQAQQGDAQEAVRPLAQPGGMIGTDQRRQGIAEAVGQGQAEPRTVADHSEGGHAGRAETGHHQMVDEQDDAAHGELVDALRTAVEAGPQDLAPAAALQGQAQQGATGQEVAQEQEQGAAVAQACGQGRPLHAPAETGDEQVIQDDIDAGAQDEPQRSQGGMLVHPGELRKGVGGGQHGAEAQDGGQVLMCGPHDIAPRSQQCQQQRPEQQGEQGQHQTGQQDEQHGAAKDRRSGLQVATPHMVGAADRTAHGEHDAHAEKNAEGRADDIDGCQGLGPDIAADEDGVHQAGGRKQEKGRGPGQAVAEKGLGHGTMQHAGSMLGHGDLVRAARGRPRPCTTGPRKASTRCAKAEKTAGSGKGA